MRAHSTPSAVPQRRLEAWPSGTATPYRHVPRWLALRDQLAAELRGRIAERVEHGQLLDEVIRELGDPLILAESYLAALPLEPAPIGRRLVAKIIDFVAVALACLTVGLAVGLLSSFVFGSHVAVFLIAACIFGVVVGFVWYTGVSEYYWGHTVGNYVMGLRVVRESGACMGPGQAVVRQLAHLRQALLFDALFIPFTERRQRALELLSKTRTVAQ